MLGIVYHVGHVRRLQFKAFFVRITSGPVLRPPVKHLHRYHVAFLQKRRRPSVRPVWDRHSPLWNLVIQLGRLGEWNESLSFALRESGIPQSEFHEWRDVVLAPDMDAALRVLEGKGFHPLPTNISEAQFTHNVSGRDDRQDFLLPTWLVLHLIQNRVKSPSQAQHSLALALYHLPAAAADVKTDILISAAYRLAIHNTLLPMHRLVAEFLQAPSLTPPADFNKLVRVIARFPQSSESRRLIVHVLDIMNARQLHLTRRTYNILLNERFMTLELTRKLLDRMKEQGIQPDAEQLESYLRIFAKNGTIHESAAYLDSIRKMRLDANQFAPYSSNIHVPDSETSVDLVVLPKEARQDYNTQYLRSLKHDPTSAFEYLRRMVDMDMYRSMRQKDSRLVLLKRSSVSLSRWRNRLDWTTVLSHAAHDKTVSAEDLMHLFRNACARRSVFRPNAVSYTCIINGLLRRRNWSSAVDLWRELQRSSLRMDKEALAVGVRALGRVGRLDEAFDTIEFLRGGGIPGSSPVLAQNLVAVDMVPLVGQKKSVSRNRLQIVTVRRKRRIAECSGDPTEIDVAVVNSFMTAARRSGRPDVAFMMWDNCELLYGTEPDIISLNILIDSARYARRFEDTVTGAIAQLQVKLKSPFRSGASAESLMCATRQEAVTALSRMLDSESKVRVTGLWRNVPAWRVVRQIFMDVLLGNWPDLAHIRGPAVTIRSEAQSGAHPFRELALGMVEPSKSRPPHMISHANTNKHAAAALLSRAGLPPLGCYPHLVPNDATFCAYIHLLGVCSLAAEIPLVLAWMRAMDVRPSHKTLSIALLFWAEVSLNAPLLERFAKRSEYSRLVEWLEGWLGHDGVPTKQRIGFWMWILSLERGR